MSTEVRAAGAIVWRVRGRHLQVLLVHRPGYNDWSWPKGKPNPGETLAECAVREVEEETGLRIVLGQPLETVRYRLGGGRSKEAAYWAARADKRGPWRTARQPVRRASSKEIDEVRWVEAHQALRLLTYDRDRVPLRILIDQWDDNRLDTWTVIIARHARAKGRSAWQVGDEEGRPLTSVGKKQSRRLIQLLSAYGTERLISSPWRRCTDTLLPYSLATATPLSTRPELTEAAVSEKRKASRKVINKELRIADSCAVICTHRPVLHTVFPLIASLSPARLAPLVPKADPYLQTSEVAVVHLTTHPKRGVRVVAIERHRPRSV